MAIDTDIIVEGINLMTQFRDRLTVHFDPAFEDDLLARAPGRHAGIGQEFLQANHVDLRRNLNCRMAKR